jgi:3-phosphoshikimate 1-carboxyvinyltransferase
MLADGDGPSIVLEGLAGKTASSAGIDCGNSGTTIRLLTGLLAGRPGEYVLSGDDSLRRRPMERVAEPLRRMGATVATTDGKPPVTVKGGALHGIDYQLPVASAQLKSAVLLAGAQARGATTVREPALSRDHTERMLAAFGVPVETGAVIRVEGAELSLPASFRVPGDASSAAFFLCAAAVIPGSDVTAEGMLLNPTRTGFLDVLRRMGADVEIEEQGRTPEPTGRVRVRYSPNLTGCEIDGREIPLLVDEVPILALTALGARGTTVFHEVGELRIKESDRLAAIRDQLGLLGGRVVVDGDKLIVEGPTRWKIPAGLDSYGDHRIAMTLRLALLMAGGDCVIDREESAGVSYPGFHEDLRGLWR